MPDERKKEMKKVRNIVTMVCALAAAAALWMLAGPQFLKFRGGAVPLGPEDDPAQAQGDRCSPELQELRPCQHPQGQIGRASCRERELVTV